MALAFDTHAHLQDPAFDADSREVARRAANGGVAGMLLCGYDEEANLAAIAMAGECEGVYAAVGFHPHDAKDVTPAMLRTLAEQAARADVWAVGEIGLDFYRDHSPHDVQFAVLRAELEIAAQVGKPVSVHTRAAEEACLEPLAEYSRLRGWKRGDRPVGVMHCFGGTLEQAERYVEVGFLISIACPITYPANVEARRIASGIPLESLVVETDSPYLPPQGLRGKRNEPANVWRAVGAIAEARGILPDAVAEATTHNACRTFGITFGAKVDS